MKNLFLITLSLVLLVSCDQGERSSTKEDQSGWANVQFKGTNYDMKLERFDPPIVFEWSELITDHERKEWFYLFETVDARVDRGLEDEEFLKIIWANLESYYYQESEAKEKEAFMEYSQSMTLEEYKEEFPFRRYTSVYAATHIKDEKGVEWVFALQQNSTDDYMRAFPWEGLDEDLVAQAKVFKKNDKGRFVHAHSKKPSVLEFISRMNIADLSEVQGMIDSGFAVLPEGEIWIKAAEQEEGL